MAGDYALAEAFVRIRPDTAGFEAETKAKIKAALAGIKPEIKVKVTPDVRGFGTAIRAAIRKAVADAGGTKIPVKLDLEADPAVIAKTVSIIRQRMAQGGLADFLDYNLPIGKIQYQILLMRRLLQQGKLTDFLATSLQPGQVLQQGAALRDALQHELGNVGIGTNLSAGDLAAEAAAAKAAAIAALGGGISIPVTEHLAGGVPNIPIPESPGAAAATTRDLAQALLREAASATKAGDAAKFAYAANVALNASQSETAKTAETLSNTADKVAGRYSALRNKITLFGGALGSIPIVGQIALWHILTDAIIETVAVIVPATIAFGAFALAAGPTLLNIGQKMKAVGITAQALGQNIYPLTGGFQKLAAAAKPATINLFGEALVVIGQNSGKLIPIITQVGNVLDTLGARAAVALTSGGVGKFLKEGPVDVAKIGDILGNIFGSIGNLLKVVPGYAAVLLTALDDVTKGIEAVTSSPIGAWVLRLGLLFHGAILYAGLAVTAFILLGDALVGLGAKFGIAAAGATFFDAVSFGQSIRLMLSGVLLLGPALLGLSGDEAVAAATTGILDGALGALAAAGPVIAVTAIAAAVYFLVKALGSATSATQSYDDATNKAIQNSPVSTVSIDIVLSMARTTMLLNQAQKQLNATQQFQLVTNLHTGLQVKQVTQAYAQQASVVTGYKGELQTLRGFQANYNQALKAAGGNTAFLTGTSISLADAITKGGQTLKEFIAEVMANVNAQKALSLGIGRSEAAQNAQTNQWMTQLLPAMQKIITAEDAITTMILSGEQAFNSFDQSLQTLGTDLGVNAGKLLGFNKAGLTVSSDIYSSVLPAFQKTIDAAQGMNVSTTDLTKIIATEAGQFLVLAGNNDTARAALVGLINNALGKGTVSFKNLNTWIKNNATSQQGLNRLWSNATIQAGTLANVLQQQLTAQFLALSLKESGAAQAAVDFKNSILRSGDASDATRQARQNLINDLINAGLSAKQARIYVQNLQNQIDATHGKTVSVAVQAYASGAVHINSNVPGGQPYSIFFHAAKGAVIPGYGGGDRYPVMVEGGEVIAPKQAGPMVLALLKAMKVPGFRGGGLVGVPGMAGSDSGADAVLGVNADTKLATGAYRKLQQAIGVGVLAGGGNYSPGLITVARYVMSHGGTAAAAAGIGGVIAGESGGNPEILQIGGGGGAGLLQWTPASSAFPIQPIITGNVSRDMGVQLVDMMAYIGSRGGIGQINAAGAIAPILAAWNFSAMEAPAVPGSDIRPDVVAALYAQGLDNGGWLPTGWSAVHNGTGSPEWVPPPARAHRARGVATQKIILDVRTSGSSDFDRFMTVWLQKSVVARGGGSVQSAWGA